MADDTSQKKPPQASSDVVLIHGVTEDGKGLHVLRARNQSIEAGQVRPLEHGKPLQGDVVKLRPRRGAPFLCDVETEVSNAELVPPSKGAGRTRARKGPAQVASSAYRDNWEAIWRRGGKDEEQLLN